MEVPGGASTINFQYLAEVASCFFPAKEHVVGWYSTGPKIKENDLEINELFRKYAANPLLVIIDVQPKELGIPTQAYCAVEDVKEVLLPTLESYELSCVLCHRHFPIARPSVTACVNGQVNLCLKQLRILEAVV